MTFDCLTCGAPITDVVCEYCFAKTGVIPLSKIDLIELMKLNCLDNRDGKAYLFGLQIIKGDSNYKDKDGCIINSILNRISDKTNNP